MATAHTPNQTDELGRQYALALQKYVTGSTAAALDEVRRLGLEALKSGLGVLDIALLHHRATISLFLAGLPPQDLEKATAALGRFCISCPAWEMAAKLDPRLLPGVEEVFGAMMEPVEANHRAVKQANVALLHLNELREEEARRIAHALHDEAGQLLASVHLGLDELARGLNEPEQNRIQEIRSRLDQISEQLRGLAHELRPTILDDLGLVPAVEFLAQSTSRRTGIPILVEGVSQPRVPAPVETAIYRIVQEALSNVTKHAHAQLVEIRFRQCGNLIACTIRDDGVGFDVGAVFTKPGARGLGLLGMRERLAPLGGILRVSSQPGSGTEVCASVPLQNRRAEAPWPLYTVRDESQNLTGR